MKCDEFTFIKLKKTLNRRGVLDLMVKTGSMAPVIFPESKIQIAPIINFDEELERFDIIVYFEGDSMTCHFIWNKKNLNISGKRDTAVTRSLIERFSNDVPVSHSHILGKVTSHRISFYRRFMILFLNFIRKDF